MQMPSEACATYHWVIDEPHGATSLGCCKRCGQTRVFRNWLAEGDFITNAEQRVAAEAA
jgi:hypothetical protein